MSYYLLLTFSFYFWWFTLHRFISFMITYWSLSLAPLPLFTCMWWYGSWVVYVMFLWWECLSFGMFFFMVFILYFYVVFFNSSFVPVLKHSSLFSNITYHFLCFRELVLYHNLFISWCGFMMVLWHSMCFKP